LPLDEALRRLLQDHDAFFFYGVERDRPASLRVVWVYPKGRGRGLMPVPPETWASTKELEGELRDADPPTRGRAVETLVKRKGERARDEVLRALADPDGRVRSRALHSALRARLDFPVELLTRLALEDSSSHVRFLALEALETRPAVIAPIASRAMHDPDPHVRSKAGEILSKLDRDARRARASGRSRPVPVPVPAD
ncbi:MAG: HEAT repeat domain-containing protein, partial [Gaiellales bacterium]